MTKRITVCRELTKIYEETISGTAAETLRYFDDNPDKVRGEFVVIVSNDKASTAETSSDL